MGGTVAETIRKENGEIIKMARKTGAYNWMFFSKEFSNNQTELAIKEHCKVWFEMKEDFETGEPYKYTMSPVYGWCNETAPIDYGLVVIDFQNKKIHSMQGYDVPAQKSLISFASSYYTDKEQTNINQFLIENNSLNLYNEKNMFVGDIQRLFGKNATITSVTKKIEKKLYKKINLFKNDDLNLFSYFKPKSLNDFEVISYKETPEGCIEMFKTLKKEGFYFNKEEIDSWKDYINRFDLEYFVENSNDYDDDTFVKIANEKKENFLSQFDNQSVKLQQKK